MAKAATKIADQDLDASALEAAGKIRPGSRSLLARVGIAVVVLLNYFARPWLEPWSKDAARFIVSIFE